MSSASEKIVPFSQFVESLSQLRPESYLNVPHVRIANEAAFNEMNAYLADYYSSAEAVHSFVDANRMRLAGLPANVW
jgi:hypothetical protein